MRSAARIALLYALLSGVYIIISDYAAYLYTGGDTDLYAEWQHIKGLGFVTASALIIFFLVFHYARSRDRIQGQLEAARKSFEDLFFRNPLPLFLYELKNLKVLAVNQAAIDAYGYSRDEFLRMTMPQYHPEEDLPKLLSHVARIKPYPYVGHWRHLHKDGSMVEVEITSHPMNFAGVEARLAVAVDISRQKLSEDTLAATMAAREEAETAKTNFLATVSHEMRTPLNAVTGFLDLLQREEDPVRRREYINLARQGAGELLTMVERLINGAALAANKTQRDAVEIEMKPFLRKITDGFFHTARRKGIKLDVTLEDFLPERALLDANRLEETLKILLENAIKFSHAGTVELRAWQEPARARTQLKIAVSDQGIGIPLTAQSRVFESFYQVDQNITRKYGGAGMGLFVAKQLCDLQGATLEVESREAVGSTFTVTLAGRLEETTLFIAEDEPPAPPTSSGDTEGS